MQQQYDGGDRQRQVQWVFGKWSPHPTPLSSRARVQPFHQIILAPHDDCHYFFWFFFLLLFAGCVWVAPVMTPLVLSAFIIFW